MVEMKDLMVPSESVPQEYSNAIQNTKAVSK
jgi:hypothetical protein